MQVMSALLPAQSNTFYQMLQKCEKLDLRDNRGKVHDVALVLMGVFIGLYRNRDGVLSAIHRSITHTHTQLCRHLGITDKPAVSRAQLPLILKKIAVGSFSQLLFKFLGVTLSDAEQQWFAADGKELRGSIAAGHKRGDVVVQVVSHYNREVHAQAFYNGAKESERPCVQQLLQGALAGQKITLDALHLIPETLAHIATQQGVYLAGLKENQKELYADMVNVSQNHSPQNTYKEIEKGHGRIDKRVYTSYAVGTDFFDERWADADFQTLVKVERETVKCKTKAKSSETAYYLSNFMGQHKQDEELFRAVRGHWNIEVNNYIRDVTWKEDDLKTKEPLIGRVMACCRTLTISLLNRLKLKNTKAKLDEFADNFDSLINWLKHSNFL